MSTILAIGVGGFFGAVARFSGVRLVHHWTGEAFPFGTLAVNILGSFGLGWILAWAENRPFSPELRAALTVGFCGGFTTMSAFGFETVALLQRGAPGLAALNAVGTVLACLAAVWLGMSAARAL